MLCGLQKSISHPSKIYLGPKGPLKSWPFLWDWKIQLPSICMPRWRQHPLVGSFPSFAPLSASRASPCIPAFYAQRPLGGAKVDLSPQLMESKDVSVLKRAAHLCKSPRTDLNLSLRLPMSVLDSQGWADSRVGTRQVFKNLMRLSSCHPSDSCCRSVQPIFLLCGAHESRNSCSPCASFPFLEQNCTVAVRGVGAEKDIPLWTLLSQI